MKVDLPPELEDLVETKVKSGNYGSAGEVIREALRIWRKGARGALNGVPKSVMRSKRQTMIRARPFQARRFSLDSVPQQEGVETTPA